MKKHNIFKQCGERVMITSRKVPLYSKLISIGNNVWVASDVEFITHDVAHFMLNGINKNKRYIEKTGCIEIGNNVFIGAGSRILYDVKIGDNVVIAAGSIVTRDIPSNSVVGGIPAKIINTFDDYVQKRNLYNLVHHPDNNKQKISIECEKEIWSKFYERRK